MINVIEQIAVASELRHRDGRNVVADRIYQQVVAPLEQKLIESERYGRQADITIENLERKVEQLAAGAQAWIEGCEPEEFGRYWVRYETEIGPRYCSAEWMEHNFCAGSDTNIHKIWLADHSRSINSLRGVTHYTKLPDSMEAAL